MSFVKKNWLARLGVGLNRFLLNGNQNVTLDSNPVSVSQAGDPLSADNMNNLEQRIGNAFDETNGNFAPIEVSPSQHNYAVGKQLVYNGVLYKVTTAIATGNNLVVGTNISKYPVSDSISDLIAQLGINYSSRLTSYQNRTLFEGVCIFYSIQKMATLKVVGTIQTSLTSSQTSVITIPYDLRPTASTLYGTCVFTSGGSSSNVEIQFNSDRKYINISHGGASIGDTFAIDCFWVVDD